MFGDVAGFVKRHPIAAISVAVVGGFLIGRRLS
jgi:hypothetical protein